MTNKGSKRLVALLLLIPLFAFTVVFFIWPLVGMMSQAVSDTAVVRLLPETATGMRKWDRNSPPTDEMGAALTTDLKAATDDLAVGDMVRRLNSAQSGFRTLMAKTLSAVRDSDVPPKLIDIDPRWGQSAYWAAIVGSLSPLTDRNLLGAIDLTRDASGSITAMPAGSSANLDIILRTFLIAGIVTIAAAVIGYPFAMLIPEPRAGNVTCF